MCAKNGSDELTENLHNTVGIGMINIKVGITVQNSQKRCVRGPLEISCWIHEVLKEKHVK